VTSPACANKVVNSSCVVNREKFRTDTLASILTASYELTSLMKKPPAHNRVGGYHTTQIQLFVLNCSVQCTTLQSGRCSGVIQSNYLIKGRVCLCCRQPYIGVGGFSLIAHDDKGVWHGSKIVCGKPVLSNHGTRSA
jgi:hypothetical protein